MQTAGTTAANLYGEVEIFLWKIFNGAVKNLMVNYKNTLHIICPVM